MRTSGEAKAILLVFLVGTAVVARLVIFNGNRSGPKPVLKDENGADRSSFDFKGNQSTPGPIKKDEITVSTSNSTENQCAPQPTHNGEKKVSEYKFTGIERYLEDLFPPCHSIHLPNMPAFLTAFSSNHFKEGRAMINNFKKTIRTKYPDLKFYVFDLGLSKREAIEIQTICNCTTRPFPFHKFPSHVQILEGYAWKPLAIQLVLKEHPFVIWMDASIRFTTPNIGGLLKKARLEGVLARKDVTGVVTHTMQATFERLNTDRRMFKDATMFAAGFIVIRATPYVIQYISQPWISCALELGCMVPPNNVLEHHSCRKISPYQCHRFEQSVLSILIHTIFRKKARDHFVYDRVYFYVCRGCKRY